MSKDVKKGLVFGFVIGLSCGIGQIVGRLLSVSFISSIGIVVICGAVGGVVIGFICRSIDEKAK
jgi:hypothetical protein